MLVFIATSEAVEGAELMLYGVSERYKESANRSDYTQEATAVGCNSPSVSDIDISLLLLARARGKLRPPARAGNDTINAGNDTINAARLPR